jgi:Uncharacterised protein family (UPF0236)
VTCPRCQQSAAFHGHRPRTLVSLFGTLDYRRAYYYCRRCGRGLCPFDEAVGLGAHQLTPAAEQLTALAGGIADSFDRGRHLLADMAALRLSEATVLRATEDVGRRLAEFFAAGGTLGPQQVWRWQRDARGRAVAYVSADHTGVRQQGPGGAAAPGRMACVGAVFNPPPLDWLRPPGVAPPDMQARYHSGLYPLEELGPLLRRQAAQVGMEQAEVWVVLTDGGNGLESLLRGHFNRPDLVVILDFYHAAGYLETLAQALHPADEQAAAALAEQWCRLLKEEGGATTLAVLEHWPWPSRRSAAVREAWQRVQEYFGNNLYRMEYPEYVAEGWHIGSGAVESACKTVVGQRLKGAGMRWCAEGTHAMCHIRALYRSEAGQWQAFWQRQDTNRKPVQQPK